MLPARRGVRLVISDSHEGLKKAAAKVLGSSWQRCAIHFMRNAMASVTPKQRGIVPEARLRHDVAAAIRTAFAQETEKEAHAEWDAVAERLADRFPRVAALMQEAKLDVLAYMSFPKTHWPQIRSTNPLERLNREVKRRTNVVSIFPNEAAIVRLVGALLLEQNDEWAASRRYMSLETMAGLGQDATVKPPAIPAA